MAFLSFNREFFADFLRILKPYWCSEEKSFAYRLLSFIVGTIILQIYCVIQFNTFHKTFYNALEKFDTPVVIHSLLWYLVIVVVYVFASSSNIYFRGILSARWRKWLTQSYMGKWRNFSSKLDNPDQRISEDLESFPQQTLSLFFGLTGFFHSLLMLTSFSYILWNLSHYFVFSTIAIPGFLCWVALLYSTLGTWFMMWLGRKLAYLDYQQQHFNADFRYFLIQMRDRKPSPPTRSHRLLDRVIGNSIRIVNLQTRISFFSKTYGFSSYVVGLAISMPFYLSKIIPLGIVMQISSAYNSVVSGFSAILESFTELANWRATIHRVTEFHQSLDTPPLRVFKEYSEDFPSS